MVCLSDWTEVQIINHLFRDATFSKINTVYFALCTTACNDASTGATMSEVANSNGYARVAYSTGDSYWVAPEGAGINYTAPVLAYPVLFPKATGSWGSIASIACLDSGTWGAGNIIFYCDNVFIKTPIAGDTIRLNIQFIIGTV